MIRKILCYFKENKLRYLNALVCFVLLWYIYTLENMPNRELYIGLIFIEVLIFGIVDSYIKIKKRKTK